MICDKQHIDDRFIVLPQWGTSNAYRHRYPLSNSVTSFGADSTGAYTDPSNEHCQVANINANELLRSTECYIKGEKRHSTHITYG